MTARLVATDLRYRYPSGFEAGPLQLDLGPGVHHLRGPNGAGKTTLLRSLCGGLRGSTGAVSVSGGDPRTDVAARAHIALLTSDPELPDHLTVDEAWRGLAAIRRCPAWDGVSVRDALGVPGGLLLGHCSAGQRRLAELLAVAVGDPEVVLLDEPFVNLDPTSIARVCEQIERWRATRVVLITSHRDLPLPVDSTVVLPAGS